MTAEEFATRVEKLISDAEETGLGIDEIIVALEGVLDDICES